MYDDADCVVTNGWRNDGKQPICVTVCPYKKINSTAKAVLWARDCARSVSFLLVVYMKRLPEQMYVCGVD